MPTQNLLEMLEHSYSNMDFAMVVSQHRKYSTSLDPEDPGTGEEGGEIEEGEDSEEEVGGEEVGEEESGGVEGGDVEEGSGENEEGPGTVVSSYWQLCQSIPMCKNMEQHAYTFDVSDSLIAIHIEPMTQMSCDVQYYFDWDRIAYDKNALYETLNGYDNVLPVINTHNTFFNGPDLPYNGIGPKAPPNGSKIRSLYVDNTTGKLKTETELTKLYETRQQEYASFSFLDFANIVKDNPNYILKEIWILKPERDSNSVRREDWMIYENNDNIYCLYHGVKTLAFRRHL